LGTSPYKYSVTFVVLKNVPRGDHLR